MDVGVNILSHSSEQLVGTHRQ